MPQHIYIYAYIFQLKFEYTCDLPIGNRPCNCKAPRFYVPHSCLIVKQLVNLKKSGLELSGCIQTQNGNKGFL